MQVTVVASLRSTQNVDPPRLNSIMVALLSFVALLLPVLLARTSPVPAELGARDQVFGQTQRIQFGVPVGSDVTRFVVKYATAQRWKQSTVASISQGASLLQKVTYILFLPRQVSLTVPSVGPSPCLPSVRLKFHVRGLPLYGYLCSQLHQSWW